jgi:predicted sulfurtransferase
VLTGSSDGIRAFTSDLKKYQPHNFEKTDFKYVDQQPDNHKLRELKVWPVAELVTYGFNAAQGRLENGGKHLSPEAYHKAMELPNTIMIDVRNFNETVIGKFKHPNLMDPCMRKSTEFPNWVD